MSHRETYKYAKKADIPIMLVDNIKDFKDGMALMKKDGISVNAFSINQHGSAGITSIGNEEISYKTNFESLREGLSGKNVLLHSCEVTKGGNIEGVRLISNLSDQTNSNVVSSDHSMFSRQLVDKSLNFRKGIFIINRYFNGEGPTSNDFHLAQPGKNPKRVFDLKMKANGTFTFKINDYNK